MPGLVDIIALRETIKIEGVPITVRGLSITTIGRCLSESEDLQKFWSGRKFDAVELLHHLPMTIARVVATSIVPDVPPPASGFTFGVADDDRTEMAGDEIAEVAIASAEAARESAVEANMAAFDELIAEHQLTLVEAVVRVSFPGGVTPFVGRVRKLAGLEAGLGQRLIDRFGKVPDGT